VFIVKQALQAYSFATYMLIDSHCHLNFDKFADDLPDVLQRASNEGVQVYINPAIDMVTSQAIISMLDQIPNLYGAVGFHPNSAGEFDETALVELSRLAQHPKVISIGEIGLDYYWDKYPRPLQQQVFKQQLALARNLDLPVIIHQRDSAEDTMAILKDWAVGKITRNEKRETKNKKPIPSHPGLVLHSFSGDVALAEEAVALGFYIGISGPLTFKNSRDLPEVVKAVPLDRLLVETDAPFLSPHPYRGKRNEPARVKLIAQKMADLKGISLTTMSHHLTENTIRLFRLKQ